MVTYIYFMISKIQYICKFKHLYILYFAIEFIYLKNILLFINKQKKNELFQL